MENRLVIEETQDTPRVFFDKASGVFEISGRSLPENAIKFYTPVLRWLEEYVASPNAKTCFDFKLDYFNSASTKKIYEIVSLMEMLVETKNEVLIRWYYSKDDELIKSKGLEMKEMVEVPFDVRTY
ncbi:MAG: DUF1987 domain-containing protein [Bacteroidia bacterium]|jgi:hypothetical protein